jgi:hypothetical protein
VEHHFNTDLAKEYGVNEAIFCHNVYFWVVRNRANKHNFHKGRYWTFNSNKAFQELFPYWSKRQLDTIIKNCQQKGLVLVDQFNQKNFDRTNWYTVTGKVFKVYEPNNHALHETVQSTEQNGAMDSTHPGNGLHETVQPIPDSKHTDKKQTDKNLVNKDRQKIIENLIFEFMKKGLPKETCLRVAAELPKRGITNLGAYFRGCLENAFYNSQVKHGVIDPFEKINANLKDSDMPYYNWMEEQT